MVKKFENMFTLFGRIGAYTNVNRQPDRQTETRTHDGIGCA